MSKIRRRVTRKIQIQRHRFIGNSNAFIEKQSLYWDKYPNTVNQSDGLAAQNYFRVINAGKTFTGSLHKIFGLSGNILKYQSQNQL